MCRVCWWDVDFKVRTEGATWITQALQGHRCLLEDDFLQQWEKSPTFYIKSWSKVTLMLSSASWNILSVLTNVHVCNCTYVFLPSRPETFLWPVCDPLFPQNTPLRTRQRRERDRRGKRRSKNQREKRRRRSTKWWMSSRGRMVKSNSR